MASSVSDITVEPEKTFFGDKFSGELRNIVYSEMAQVDCVRHFIVPFKTLPGRGTYYTDVSVSMPTGDFAKEYCGILEQHMAVRRPTFQANVVNLNFEALKRFVRYMAATEVGIEDKSGDMQKTALLAIYSQERKLLLKVNLIFTEKFKGTVDSADRWLAFTNAQAKKGMAFRADYKVTSAEEDIALSGHAKADLFGRHHVEGHTKDLFDALKEQFAYRPGYLTTAQQQAAWGYSLDTDITDGNNIMLDSQMYTTEQWLAWAEDGTVP